VGTTERLKMLCLLTYADVKSVSPDALTPWKAEMMWQLYAAAANHLTLSLDENRVHAGLEEEAIARRVQKELAESVSFPALAAFLEGFPRRYLLTHSPAEIASHFRMAQRSAQDPIQVALNHRQHSFELTVLAPDRPFLFASLTGALAAWGMNILKADAFANAKGMVLDTIRFADLFRTLELNPSERGRFERSVADVLAGKVNLQDLLRGRMHSQSLPRVKVRMPTQVRFEDLPTSGSARPGTTRSTVLEVITHDRPGVLYLISSTLAELGLNIEIALVDTEGQKVIDVFYLTFRGAPLDPGLREKVREDLLQKLR
jgi:[protein-PII] uridylyltransferase